MAGNLPVIVPCVQRYDNHPDLSLASGVKEWLEGVTPSAILDLCAEVRRLRAEANAFTTISGDLNQEMWSLYDKCERYKALCAAAYQLAGLMNAPVRFLDALSDAANGELEARAKTDDLLPVLPTEVGAFPAESTDAPDNLLVSLFYAAQGNITNFRIRAREILRRVP
jgi:hypothetical protein